MTGRNRRRSGFVLCAAFSLVLGACVPPAPVRKGPPGAEEARVAYRAVVKKARKPKEETKPLEMPWLEKIGNFLKAVMEWAVRHKVAVIVAVCVVAAAGVVYALIRGGRPRGIRIGIGRDAPARTRGRKPGSGMDTEELIALAEERAAAGDFSEAAVILHRAALVYLTERGMLRQGRSYGNAEIRSILEKRGPGAREFAAGARSAESTAFGRRVLARSDWEEALEASRGLMGALA
jgi:hypothetical protein